MAEPHPHPTILDYAPILKRDLLLSVFVNAFAESIKTRFCINLALSLLSGNQFIKGTLDLQHNDSFYITASCHRIW